MDTLLFLFGEGKDLNPLQTAMRAVVVFAIGLALVRLSGRRSFGQRAPFDFVVAVLLGATLSRAIVGASPFVATISASLALVAVHRLLGGRACGCPSSSGSSRAANARSIAKAGSTRARWMRHSSPWAMCRRACARPWVRARWTM